MAVDGDRNEEYIDEFSDEDFSETSSQATVEGHPTPRISPSISTLNDADVPHRSLDDLPLPAEHPADPMIETTDWAATSTVEITEVNQITEPDHLQGIEITEVEEAEDTEEEDEIEDGQDTEETEETEVTENNIDNISMSSTRSLRPSDFQRFLGAESARAVPSSPWQPTVPWEKRTALAPVRNEIVRTPSQFSGTETRRRKTSDSIKSLVDHFENLSPMSTPTKDKFGKDGSFKDGSIKDNSFKDGSVKEGSVNDGSIEDSSKNTDKGA